MFLNSNTINVKCCNHGSKKTVLEYCRCYMYKVPTYIFKSLENERILQIYVAWVHL